MKLSEVRDNAFGGICAGVAGVFCGIAVPAAIVVEMIDGMSLQDATESVGEEFKDATSSAFEWGKENAETAGQITGLALGIGSAVARHNARGQNKIGAACSGNRHAESAPIVKVRRARFGPGLWPGPRCQARWAGRGSGVKGGS